MINVISRNRFTTKRGMVYEFLEKQFVDKLPKKGGKMQIDGEKVTIGDIERPHHWPSNQNDSKVYILIESELSVDKP